jgi:hypothetical protein
MSSLLEKGEPLTSRHLLVSVTTLLNPLMRWFRFTAPSPPMMML